MGLIVSAPLPPKQDEQAMSYEWFVGIDWGSQQHQVCVIDLNRRVVGERVVDHDGSSLAQLATWLLALSPGQPHRVSVAIEVPRGAIVEGLIERGFHVFAINPKQLDRFRDPYGQNTRTCLSTRGYVSTIACAWACLPLPSPPYSASIGMAKAEGGGDGLETSAGVYHGNCRSGTAGTQ